MGRQQILLQGQAQETFETATTPPSSGPVNLTHALSPPPQLPVRLAPRFNQEHLNSPTMGLASPLEPTALQMPL
jgi:hypothetical protein